MAKIPTSNEIYELVDRSRLELKGDIMRVEAAFGVLQNTVIASMQKDINDLKVKNATFTTKMAVLGVIGVAVIGVVASYLTYKITGAPR